MDSYRNFTLGDGVYPHEVTMLVIEFTQLDLQRRFCFCLSRLSHLNLHDWAIFHSRRSKVNFHSHIVDLSLRRNTVAKGGGHILQSTWHFSTSTRRDCREIFQFIYIFRMTCFSNTRIIHECAHGFKQKVSFDFLPKKNV